MKLLTLIKNLIFHQEVSCERKVKFHKENGVVTNIPIDTKGLRLVSGEPYSNDAVYEITNKWDGWDYLGDGLYSSISWRSSSLKRDMHHPSSVQAFNKHLKDFSRIKTQ